MRVESALYVNASEVLNEEQLEYLKWNLPVTLGDADLTLVTKRRIIECLTHEFDMVDFAKLLHLPSNCFINLERET